MCCGSVSVHAQLKVGYTPQWGLSYINYNGNALLDISSRQGSPITLEAFCYSNRAGRVMQEWSHVSATHWDEQQKLYTVDCKWGSLLCRYLQKADTLLFTITFINKTKTDTFYGLSFCPVGFSFDQRPLNFQPLYPYYNNNRIAPTLIYANLGAYKVLLESTDLNDHTYLGFREEANSTGKRYAVWSGNWLFNGMTDFDPASTLRVAPGKSYTYSFAMKFLAGNTALKKSSAAAIKRFTDVHPSMIKWEDRRPVGMVFLSSYNQAAANKSNPRRWVIADKGIDNTAAGKLDFKKKLLDFADASIAILQQTHAQGMITWDLEGQQYPHPLSYIGSPDLLPVLAPEMNEVADAWFQRFSAKGLKTGVCIRPDSIIFYKEKNWIDHVAVKDPAATMIRKIAYARKRWGCSIFYVDSNIGEDGQPMKPEVFMAVRKKFPDVLLIPEHKTLLYYACTAPYGDFKLREYKVSDDVKQLYPGAFMSLVVPEGFPSGSTPEQQKKMLKAAADEKNILLFRCWYHDEPVNSMIEALYR